MNHAASKSQKLKLSHCPPNTMPIGAMGASCMLYSPIHCVVIIISLTRMLLLLLLVLPVQSFSKQALMQINAALTSRRKLFLSFSIMGNVNLLQPRRRFAPPTLQPHCDRNTGATCRASVLMLRQVFDDGRHNFTASSH